jgi:ditrans,polycis-polyprenyl diphosphate synthase
VKVRLCGALEKLPQEQLTAIREVEAATAHLTQMTLNVCVAYGSLEEISQALGQFGGGEEFSIEAFEQKLWVQEPVDLLVRTGEARLSNFLLHQVREQAKLILLRDCYWPELSVYKLAGIMLKYQFFL